jgi:hypothetical protein
VFTRYGSVLVSPVPNGPAGGILEVPTKESDDAEVRLGSRFH